MTVKTVTPETASTTINSNVGFEVGVGLFGTTGPTIRNPPGGTTETIQQSRCDTSGTRIVSIGARTASRTCIPLTFDVAVSIAVARSIGGLVVGGVLSSIPSEASSEG